MNGHQKKRQKDIELNKIHNQKMQKIILETPSRIVFQFMRRRTSAASNVRPGISHEEKKFSELCYFERGLAHKVTPLI